MNSQQQTTSNQKTTLDQKIVPDKKTVSDPKRYWNKMIICGIWIEMTITAISHPFPSIVRIQGEINTTQPDLWTTPNLYIRLEVLQQANGLPISCVYTVRCFDPVPAKLNGLVLHADPSPAMLWLDSAKIGTKIQLTGPRPHFSPHLLPQPNAWWCLLTKPPFLPLCPLYSIGKRDSGDFIESCEANIIDDLPKHHGVNIHLLHREKPQQAGKLGMLLKVAEQFKDRDISVWTACERNEARAIRKLFTQHSHLKVKMIFVLWAIGMSACPAQH